MSAFRRSISVLTVSSALVGLVAGSLVGTAGAQETGPADHPVVGAWMATTPNGPRLLVFHADGTVVIGTPSSQAGPQGVTFASTRVGAWEPTGERTMRFTAVSLTSDANGAYAGSVTTDASQAVSEDGETWVSTAGTVTVRDVEGNITLVLPPGDEPARGIRISVGSPGFPEASPAASSPTP